MVSLIKCSQVILVLLSCWGSVLKTIPEKTLEGKECVRLPGVPPCTSPLQVSPHLGTVDCPHSLGVLFGCPPMYPQYRYPPLGIPTLLDVTPPRVSILGVPPVSPPPGDPTLLGVTPPGVPPGCSPSVPTSWVPPRVSPSE